MDSKKKQRRSVDEIMSDLRKKQSERESKEMRYVVVAHDDDSSYRSFHESLNHAMDVLGEFEAEGYDGVNLYTVRGLANVALRSLVENSDDFENTDKRKYGDHVGKLVDMLPDDLRKYITDDDRIDAVAYARYLDDEALFGGDAEDEDEPEDDDAVTITIGKKSLGNLLDTVNKIIDIKKKG